MDDTYQVGTRVQANKNGVGRYGGNNPYDLHFGETGTIVGIHQPDGSSPQLYYYIRWDRFVGFRHKCSGRCDGGHGLNLIESEFDVVTEDDWNPECISDPEGFLNGLI